MTNPAGLPFRLQTRPMWCEERGAPRERERLHITRVLTKWRIIYQYPD